MSGRFLIVGGAGFIGSHFVSRLLSDRVAEGVTVYDNFSSGREWHYAEWMDDHRLSVIRADVREHDRLVSSMVGHEVVIHLASNPDIARAVSEPAVDFEQGTALTHGVVEAARQAGVRTILYASGSGVYGDLGEVEASEDDGALVPISTYGASKLAGEALIGAYCFMFGLVGRAFRFGNVVGSRQNHGVGSTSFGRLPRSRLGCGSWGTEAEQVVHRRRDVVEAVLTALRRESAPFRVYNVATGDYVTVGRSPIWRWKLSDLGRDRWRTSSPEATADGRETFLSSGSTPTDTGSGLGQSVTTAEALRNSLQALRLDR